MNTPLAGSRLAFVTEDKKALSGEIQTLLYLPYGATPADIKKLTDQLKRNYRYDWRGYSESYYLPTPHFNVVLHCIEMPETIAHELLAAIDLGLVKPLKLYVEKDADSLHAAIAEDLDNATQQKERQR